MQEVVRWVFDNALRSFRFDFHVVDIPLGPTRCVWIDEGGPLAVGCLADS